MGLYEHSQQVSEHNTSGESAAGYSRICDMCVDAVLICLLSYAAGFIMYFTTQLHSSAFQ